jgi:hypothetical protein
VAAFDDVRSIALGLPETAEVVTWGTDITFRVGKKIFAIGGDGSDRVSVKATPAAQADLIDRDPQAFASAPYVGRFGWVNVDLRRIDKETLRTLLVEAWRQTAPKRLAARFPELEA